MANALTLPRPQPLLRDIAARAAALWRAYPRETIGAGLFGLVAAAAIASASLHRGPNADGWRRAIAVATAAMSGAVYAPVGWATHYHADYVVPYWTSTMAKNTVVGAHLFYRWPGGWGQPSAFAKAYGGREPSADLLRAAALAAVHV